MKTEIEKNMNIKNEYLSSFACKDRDAYRLKDEKEDIRTPFFHDIDKILYNIWKEHGAGLARKIRLLLPN